jgi:hypothetical protein
MLNYSDEEYIVNSVSSGTESINPYDNFTFAGSLTLNPPGDTWFDQTTKPLIYKDDNGTYDTLIPDSVGEATYGSIWNSWKQVWYSPTNTDKVKAIEGGAVITEASVTGSSTSVIFPYVRNISIKFVGNKLKPNTKLYAFFNEYNVTGLCYSANTTANVTASFGSGELNQSNIITDSRGSVTGVFNFDVNSSGLKIPAGKINFRLTDSATNGNNKETFADAVFNANGTLSKIEPPRVVYTPPVTYTPVISAGGGTVTQVGSTSTGVYPPVPVYPPSTPFPPTPTPPPTPGFAEYAGAFLQGGSIANLSAADRARYEGYYKTSLANAGVSEATFQTQMGTAPLAGSTTYRDGDGYNFISGAAVTSTQELENGMPINSYLTATNVLDARASGGTGQLFIQDVKNTVGDTYWNAVVIPVYEGTKAAVADAVKAGGDNITAEMMSFYQAGLANGSWIESTQGVQKAIENYAAALTLAVIEKPATDTIIVAGRDNGLVG